MISNKIRTAVITTATVAALSMPSVAAALTVTQKLVKPVAKVTTHIAPATPIKEAGSAGVPGYDDATCQQLLNDYNTAVNHSESELLEGSGTTYGELANRIYGQLSSNCMTVG